MGRDAWVSQWQAVVEEEVEDGEVEDAIGGVEATNALLPTFVLRLVPRIKEAQ